MQRSFLLVLNCLFAIGACIPASQAIAGEAPTVVSSSLQSVMVYRNGAEMVHTAKVRLGQGNSELIIDDVSTMLEPSTIRVNCGGNVTILSATFSKDFLAAETVSPMVKRLQDSIGVLDREQERLSILSKSDEQLLDLLNSNKTIGGTQNGVSAAELAKMMDYYRQQQLSLRTELSGYADKAARLTTIREALERQISEEQNRNTKTTGRILLQVLTPSAGTYDFTVSYLTMAAHWEPAYDLKVSGVSDPLQLLYKARLVQSSGIDWKHVKLSLSTSLPTQNGNAPVLKERFLRFAEAISLGYQNELAMQNSLAGQAQGAYFQNFKPTLPAVTIRGIASAKKNVEPIYVVNGSIMSKEEFERIDSRTIADVKVMKEEEAQSIYGAQAEGGVIVVTLKNGLGDHVSVNDNQLDVVFDIDVPYDIPSNGKEQGVVMKEYKVPCTFQDYAAPVAVKEAFLLGQLQGWEKLNLLPGEASIMVDGTYIGKSFIDPGSTLDTLNLTLGQDKRIVVKREKVADFSSVKFLGSSKKEVFTYELTVRNTKKEKALVMLKDQYPISTDKDIEVELLENAGATVNKDNGVLTWHVELAAGETRTFRISYSVKYPKDKTVNIN